ncbi:tol-pal system-associated acyl-CoA thioesterase [Roseinatronobacter alkalisoli]|uniref:Tol-pal system-associated acyl-CoA thioesterase n=1 Tax=Roseinatronobacter alkalisoli TaxID=3028235 RepID=A0ABT5T5F2_9RHOB|nr:tol-pal system-associated acyl-CoA thioesterase [Roseinatronobacter sp. HJB301]MDD7970347.1 tol-pal system-associated acyl-CoA thioesterase [Roseinatronobacter sp. HJB301]
MPHRITIRVYYEDTDLAGIVYYANYLKFIERGRSEWVRDLGIDQAKLKAEGGGVFAVRRVVADYRAPARFDDLLDVTTEYQSHTGARLELRQCVLRGGKLLFEARVTLVCLAGSGRPQPLPAGLIAGLNENITI